VPDEPPLEEPPSSNPVSGCDVPQPAGDPSAKTAASSAE
jgi:hypothetical protein